MLGKPLSFDALPNWANDDHGAALRAFEKSARRILKFGTRTRALNVDAEALKNISTWLHHLDEGILGQEARIFFEDHFVPRQVLADADDHSKRGFVTGYYEPEVPGSRTGNERFKFPLLRRPDDLVELNDLPEGVSAPKDWDEEIRFARLSGNTVEHYLDRKAIEEGGLDGKNLELVFLEDPIDAFFIHIQGSARIRLTDDSIMRVSFDGKSGHDYTPIGRELIKRGEIAREEMSMQAIRHWLSDNRDQQYEIMWHNRSFIFFKEQEWIDPNDGPIGAAAVPLTPFRSLAVDRTLHTFGTPIYLNADLDIGFQKLMIAQDTGSAIVGPARGDIFFGSGDEAEQKAGIVQHPADFYLLWPKSSSL